MAWYTQTKEVRASVRGRQITSKYAVQKRAERTLRVRKVTPQEVAELKNGKSDPDRNNYQVHTEKGRVIW
jgi:CYTH domain-containing protein